MDSDGAGFTFPPASDFNNDQESSDISWGDIFLDGIQSEESALEKLAAGELDVPSDSAGPPVINQQLIQQQQTQQQQGIMGGQVHIQIPTHLQGSLANSGLQQTSSSISGSVAYLTPSVTSSQIVSSDSGLQNVITAAGQRLVTTSVAQQTQQPQQPNAKLVQLAPSFPVASVQQLPNSVPLQTLLQSNQALSNQTIYRSQSRLFPTQGSVHIENPKVVNVNFGPHVIGSDGGSQQALLQSLNLTQPLVGTQLLNQAGGNMLRTTLAQGAQQPVTNQPRHIVLPSGQTVIPKQPDAAAAAKNVVLGQLNSSVPPVIYPGGQTGQLQLQTQSTALITSSGQGLQVVNTGGGQGNQVQLIAQPQIGQGQQQLNQSAIMNLLNSQGVLNNGLVSSGQNILVNGQVVNLGQLGGLAIQQQLQLQQQQQQQQQQHQTAGVSLNQTVVSRPVGRQLQQQLQNQSSAQQQLFLSQNSSNGVGMVGNNTQQQIPAQIMLQQQQQKVAVGIGTPLTNLQHGTFRTGGSLTPNNTGSNCSTPAPTPTPSTPTPTPTPDLMLDSNSSNGGKGGQSSNILEQALTMSQIDLQSFEDDFNFLAGSDDCSPSVPAAPAPSVTPVPAPKSKPKRQSKKSKAASQQQQQQEQPQTPSAPLQNTQGQKVTLGHQQKIITMNGQVYVLSANSQQLILQQPSTTSSTATIAPQLKPIPSQTAASAVSSTPSRTIPSNATQQRTPQLLLAQNNNSSPAANVRQHQQKPPIIPSKIGFQAQKNVFVSASLQSDKKVYVKTSAEGNKVTPGKASLQVEAKTSAPLTLSTAAPSAGAYSVQVHQTQINPVKSQKITTLEGSFVKQEPLTAVIKQEPVGAVEQVTSFPSSQSIAPTTTISSSTTLTSSVFQSISQAITSGTNSNVVPVSSSLVVSTAMTCTVTTQFHQNTIMTTSASIGTAAGACITTTSTASTTSKSSSTKEKDPNTIKSMTPIKIANATLMLSLTPAQKERLEDHLSRMTMKEQNEFLTHQQNLNRRIQQVQQEQQQKLLQQQQQKQQQEILKQQQNQVNQQPSAPVAATAASSSSQLPSQKAQQTASQQLLLKHHQQPSAEPAVTNRSVPDLAATGLAQASALPTTVEELENEITEGKKKTQVPTSQAQHEQLVQQQRQQQTPPAPPRQSQPAVPQVPQAPPQGPPCQTGPSQAAMQHMVDAQFCLARQQLSRDCSLARKPDTDTPFRNLSDAMRRLVRYHTLQDHKPEEDSKVIKTWDTKYSKLCDNLVKRKRFYMRRYHKLRLYHDMCPERRPESLQNLLCFNEQLKEAFEAEKEEAKNHPETFQPVRPVVRAPSPVEELQASLKPEKSVQLNFLSREERRASKKAKRKDSSSSSGSHYFKEPFVKEEVTESRTKHEIWESPKPSFSSLKRKCSPERGSSGTLKLVFKRRTTDDFSVKNSVELSRDLKPVVNLEKSDSEYEFEAGGSSRASQSVKVRRRTSSQSFPSRQASLDASSEHSSVDHSSDEASEDLSSEEEEDKEDEDDRSQSDSHVEEDDREGEEEDEEDAKVIEIQNSFNSSNKSSSSKRNFHVSFEDGVEDQDGRGDCTEADTFQEARNDREEGDAFMETDEPSLVSDLSDKKSHSESGGRNSLSSVFKFSDISSVCGSLSSGKKSCRSLSKSASVTSAISDDVFSAASIPDCGAVAEDFNVTSVVTCADLNGSSLQAMSTEPSVSAVSQASKHRPTFQPLGSLPSPPHRRRDTVLAVSSMEKEAASKGLPSSSILNTPSKRSLLQTDAMFNSSEDDEDDSVMGSNQTRLVSRFKIDNRDPQSSMINDSVRSAINRVLIDDDDSNGHEGEDSQASWSSAHRAPSSASSSVAHNGIFRLSSSPSVHTGHDTDLDAAVQSILNG